MGEALKGEGLGEAAPARAAGRARLTATMLRSLGPGKYHDGGVSIARKDVRLS
jgi:hypothetical protein